LMSKGLDRHRNLYNGDFGLYFWTKDLWQPEGGPFSRQAIHRFVELLAKSGVDTFLLNPNTQVAWYPSKVVPTIIDGYVWGDDDYLGGTWGPDILDPYLDLIESGVDILAETIAACRENGISPWVSMRMNDMHWGTQIECKANSPLLSDPDCRLSGKPFDPNNQPYIYWQALNYENSRVREYMLGMIRELVLDYDFEGLELDWMRNPNCCEPVASQETIDSITNWHSEIRSITNNKCDYPLGIRCPVNYGLFRRIGIDVKEMVFQEILDFVCPTNFMQTTWDAPHDRLRSEFGDKVTIYGVSELMINSLPGYCPATGVSEERNVCSHPAAIRGNTAGKLVMEADGIEQYNFYWTHSLENYTALEKLCDLDYLRGQEKHYAISSLGHPCHYYPYDIVEPLPRNMLPGSRDSFTLAMCAEPVDSDLELIVQIVVRGCEEASWLGVSFNQSWPVFESNVSKELLFSNGPSTHIPPDHTAFNFKFNAADIQDGWNDITIYHSECSPLTKGINVVSIELAVKTI